LKLVILNDKLVGELLGSSIYTQEGVMFLKKGSILTESIIKRLNNIGINTIYIEDGNDDFTLQEVIPTTVRLSLLKAIREVFEEVKKTKSVNYYKVVEIIDEAIENINLSENAVMLNNLVPKDDIAKLALHSLNVTVVSLMLGTRRKCNQKKLVSLGIGALLHDIGKLFTQGKEHTEVGYKLVKSNTLFSPLSYMSIYELYEKKDGSGPLGIKGDKIFEFSKIVSICNAYTKYIEGEGSMLPHVAVEKIAAEATTSYDDDIYRDFVNSIYCYPNGLPVRLNNGLEGVVIGQNKNNATRPIVQAKVNGKYNFYNLLQSLTIFIEDVIL
jgi:HD-GYP domain-containing protein (c-di-GMP phosphodiesterase class II)